MLDHGASARAGAGITGRWLATADDADDELESTHQFEAAADFLAGRVRPGVTLRVPLDDDLLETDLVLGLTLGVRLD